MSVAAVVSIFGIQGGLGSMLLADEPILESPHAASAFIFALLFGLQVSSYQTKISTLKSTMINPQVNTREQ
jgi:hypothetical protein